MSLEPNDTIFDAHATGLTSSDPGTFTDFASIGDNDQFAPENDVDFFSLQLNSGDRLTVDIDANEFGGSLDSVLRVFDEFGNEVAWSDDAPAPDEFFSLDSFIDFTATASGNYFVGVSGYANFSYDPFTENSGFGGSTGDYTITITVEPFIPILGTNGADVLIGTNRTDTIEALGGNDTVNGRGGDDQIFGGRGNDVLFGGDGTDFVSGGRGSDVLYGDDANGFGYGDDQLFGDQGNDLMFGGYGYDNLYGGAGADDLYGGSDNDWLYGEGGNDLLIGGYGYDYLYGGGGNDILIGVELDGYGEQIGAYEQDTLVGGAGRDTFVLGTSELVFYDDGNPSSTGEYDYAVIADFNSQQDTLQLKGSADLYVLDFFVWNGVSSAALLFDTDTTRGEQIAILENLAPGSLDLTSSAFVYV